MLTLSFDRDSRLSLAIVDCYNKLLLQLAVLADLLAYKHIQFNA